MPDETSEPQTTEKKRALAVRNLKPKSDPKGGAAKGGKSDKVTPRTEEVDFNRRCARRPAAVPRRNGRHFR